MTARLSRHSNRWPRAAATILVAGITVLAGLPSHTATARVAADSGTTFLGTPRSQTLIVDNIDGRIATPGNFNPYAPGVQVGGDGVHALNWSPLWEIDTVKGTQFPDLASQPIQPLDKNWTRFKITLRQGLTWTDGVAFNANDVLFTLNMLLSHTTLPEGAYLKTLIKAVKPIDDYSIEVDTFTRQAHIQRILGSYIWDSGFRVIPEHIWKNVNPLTYTNNPPIGLGPYKLVKFDPNGYWFLWQLRDDWQHSDVGQIEGKPGPKYLLVQFYGTEQQRVIAAIQHKLDVLMPVSPNGWGVMKSRDSYALAWYKDFPYADENDPANRSITFNDQTYPYNMWQVRWALALSINLPQVTLSYGGMLRASILPFPATDLAEQTVYKSIEPWLAQFALPDGFRPYDPNYASEVVSLLKQRGFSGLPTDPAEITHLFGPGWFKYDPQEASKLLKSVGFKFSAGTWIMPNGNPWSIIVNGPANFEPESGNLAFAVANQWKQFGIDASGQGMDSTSFWTAWSQGTYQAGAYWPVNFLTPDSSDQLTQFDAKYLTATGKPATSNAIRWNNAAASKIVEQMQTNPPEDPQTLKLEQQFLQIFFKEMPFIPGFCSTQLVPVDSYYWTNFPTSTNQYDGPWWWWSNFKFILPNIKPTGK